MRGLLLYIILSSSITCLSQQVNLLTVDQLNQRIANGKDTAYIINFWATWCAPCVAELPHFQRLQQHLRNEAARVLLVSVDFRSKLESTVKPFVRRRKLKNDVFLLNETNQQEYIDRIDSSWSGTIPATLFVSKDKRRFLERSFTYPQLLQQYQNLK